MVEPTVVVTGFGLYAVVVKVDAPDTMLMVADGVGEGPAGLSSHPMNSESARINKLVRMVMTASRNYKMKTVEETRGAIASNRHTTDFDGS
jgi:hypothetical protein